MDEKVTVSPVPHEFYVVMQRRSDGVVYADLNKTDERMYLVRDEADAALAAKGDLAKHFHVVRMLAYVDGVGGTDGR